MTDVRYLTHPKAAIDPTVPVPNWDLSDIGRARTRALAQSGRLSGTRFIFCSDEIKARDTARILGDSEEIAPQSVPAMAENDRSATGFLAPDQFETVADAFFARPDESVLGWERATDAQACILGVTSTPKTPPFLCRVRSTKGQTNEGTIYGRTDHSDNQGT